MRKYSEKQLEKGEESNFMKSAIVFRKLSETIKVYTEPQINKALYDVKERIQKQNTLEMKANWSDLKRLLVEKKNMMKRERSLRTEEKSFRKMESSISKEIIRSSNAVIRRNIGSHEQQANVSFCEDQFVNIPTKFQRKSKPEKGFKQSNKYRINRFQLNKQNTKIAIQSQQTLKQLAKSFCSNPQSITSKHFQTYYNTKKQYVNALVSFPSADYFKKLNQNIYDHQSRYKIKKIPQLQRQGTEIQNYLNQCSQVLQKHYLSLDKLQEAQNIKNHRISRHTFENNKQDKKIKNKLKICQLRKIIPRKRIKQLASNFSTWFKINK